MKNCSEAGASATQSTPHTLTLVGRWTARGLGGISPLLASLHCDPSEPAQIDAKGINQLDTAGAWVLHKLLVRLRGEDVNATLQGLHPDFARLLQAVVQHEEAQARLPATPPAAAPQQLLERVGRSAGAAWEQSFAMLGFVGECAQAFAG